MFSIRNITKNWDNILALIFFIFLQNLSNSQAQNTLLSGKDEIEFPLRTGERLDPVHPIYCKVANEMGIMYIDYANKDLVFRTLTGTKDSVRNIKLYNYQFVQNFLLLENGDGIFAMNANYFGGNHNKCLLLYNSDNVLLDTIDARIPKIEKFKDQRPRDSTYFSVFTYSSILFNHIDSSIYVPITPYAKFFVSKNNRDLLVFMKVFFSKKGIKPTPIIIRDFWVSSDSILFPLDIKFPRTVETEKYIYIGFGHTPNLYRLNKKNHRIKLIEVKSELIEMYPYTKGDYSSDRYGTILNYKNIYFDAANNCFIRTVVLPVGENDNPIYMNYRSTLIQKIKPNGHIIWEKELPFGFTNEMLIIEGDYWFYNRYESERKKSLVYSKYVGSEKVTNLVTENDAGILPYIEHFTNTSSDGDYLIIPLDNSCSSCLQQLESFIKLHADLLYNDAIKIVFITQYEDKISTFFSNLDMENEHRSNWIFDLDNTIKEYEKLWVNPRFIQIRNNNVEYDEIYDPAELIDLFSTLRKYCN